MPAIDLSEHCKYSFNKLPRHGYLKEHVLIMDISIKMLKKFVQPTGFIYVCVTNRLHNIMRRDVFQAIADPTRREILNMIAYQTLNLNSVSENFDISRPAISKHIKILTECGLIEIKRRGRERYCEAKLQKLNEVSQWVEQYRKFWAVKLNALENFLNKNPLKSKSQNVKKSKQSRTLKSKSKTSIRKRN